MSASNARARGELKSNLGKRRKDEEFINDEEEDSYAESPVAKKASSKHQREKNSHKKKRRDHSVSSGSKDQSMMDDDDLDDEDDDDYDEEDADEELNDFIAPDEEAEEELMQEVEAENEQYRKKKKRKHKRREDPKLSDDDLELIHENIGVEVKKKRRLQKNIDSDDQREQSDQEQKEHIKGRKIRRPIDDDEEIIDTSSRVKQRVPRGYDGYSDQEYEQQRATIRGNKIFQDPQVLQQQLKYNQQMREQERKTEQQQANLEEMFDGDEIDDQFATKNDKIIAQTDIPERLQIKLGERLAASMPDIDQDIKKEVQWVWERLTYQKMNDNLIMNEHQAKLKIETVIRNFRVNYMDIPYIAKYRKFEYLKELNEEIIWQIFNLDLEYGRFQQQLKQNMVQLQKLVRFDKRAQEYYEQIQEAKDLQQLENYTPLIGFLKAYYHEELQRLPDEKAKKVPLKQDHILKIRKARLDLCAKNLFLDPYLFMENLIQNRMIHEPQPVQNFQEFLHPYISDSFSSLQEVAAAAKKYQAQALSVQPYLRNMTKRHFYHVGTISTEPTEKGKKEIDPFHPSYRVKRIKKEPLMNIKENKNFSSIFLDILANEKGGYITVHINYEVEDLKKLQQGLAEKYISDKIEQSQAKFMIQSIEVAITDILVPELTKEIKDELRQASEQAVLLECQMKYHSLLMTGPFDVNEGSKFSEGHNKNRRADDPIIPDRPRCTVMGVILQQIDNINSIVSLAIVDKYGELLANLDLQHLMPPRKFTAKRVEGGTDEDEQRYKKSQQLYREEMKTHEDDKETVKDLMISHQVELVVVGANKLAARQIRQTLADIAEGIKQFNYSTMDQDDQGNDSKGRKGSNTEEFRKEAIVIWGSLDIPKLFANSHQSQKLLKNYHPILKQAISLARYQQDPMNEILNLWSFIPAENQALHIDLHPLQKLINQAKLAEALEEVNVKCVNAVGIDINLISEHEHMFSLLNFVSYFGPRKAKNFINFLRQKDIKIESRKMAQDNFHYGDKMWQSAGGFLKIRTPSDRIKNQELLDLTRIHPESYNVALKMAKDVVYAGQDMQGKLYEIEAVASIIKNPSKIRELDLKQYILELERLDSTAMLSTVESILEEFQHPFKDPREYQKPSALVIKNEDLFYMLIDESPYTFKRGIIVTATVSKVLDKMVICKLDNGLDATIQKNDLEKTDERLQQFIQQGHVITGRIQEIKFQEVDRFGVTLNCQKKNLESHENYINKDDVDREDWQNQAFSTDKKANLAGKMIFRRIAHPKFQNINSKRAIDTLQSKDVGEFIFRPSSKGENNITLTWKFYQNNIVHIDIQEHDKPVGASIGAKLIISDESFENLQEIIDRYIMPCNRNVKEACMHIKFLHCNNVEELDKNLRDEKAADAARIPYKITILSEYPQHLVLGYLPKNQLIKEYIRVKPRGFYFHDKYHSSTQSLINWFKQNFSQREYIRQMKRQKSPRAKAPQDLRQSMPVNVADQQRGGNEWSGVGKEWRKSAPNSVHSLNDDGEGNTQYVGQTFRDNDHGRSNYNPGQSEHNQSSGRKPQNCFNCQQDGHISRDCPQKSQKSFGRGSKGPSAFGRGQRRDNDFESGGNNQSDWASGSIQPQRSNDTAWDQPAAIADQNSMQIDSQGGWGVTNTPGNIHGTQAWPNQASNIGESITGAWGNTQTDQWGNADTHQDNGQNSPSRSVRSDGEGFRGRGRGMGRGRGGGGSNMDCFKCNQPGHFSRECPNQNSSTGRGRGGQGRGCYKCNQEGHFARECPNSTGDDGGRGRGSGRGGGGNRACFKCNQEGHMSFQCPNDGDGGDRSYKRQRGDGGGSVRRDDGDNNNWASNGDQQAWGADNGGNADWSNARNPANAEPANQSWNNQGGFSSHNQQNNQTSGAWN